MATIKKGTYRWNEILTDPYFTSDINIPFIVPTWYVTLTDDEFNDYNTQLSNAGYPLLPSKEFTIDTSANIMHIFSRNNGTDDLHIVIDYGDVVTTVTPYHEVADHVWGEPDGYISEVYNNLLTKIWRDEVYRYITIPEDTVVEDEVFATWFNENTKPIIKAGSYRFNDVLTHKNGTEHVGFNQPLNFTFPLTHFAVTEEAFADAATLGEEWANKINQGYVPTEEEERQFMKQVLDTLLENGSVKSSIINATAIAQDGYHIGENSGSLMYEFVQDREHLTFTSWLYDTDDGWLTNISLAEFGYDYTIYGEGIKTITLETDQTVETDFYEWFAANTKPIIKAGVYKFKDSISVIPHDTFTLMQSSEAYTPFLAEYGFDITPVIEDGYVVRRLSIANTFGDEYDNNNVPHSLYEAIICQVDGVPYGIDIAVSRFYGLEFTIPRDTEVNELTHMWFNENTQLILLISDEVSTDNIKAKIQNLIKKINSTTNQYFTDLTTGMKVLMKSYVALVYTGAVKIFLEFLIDNIPYTADKGMTWGEWLSSDYNTEALTSYDNTVMSADGYTVRRASDNSLIYISEPVTAEAFYIASNAGTITFTIDGKLYSALEGMNWDLWVTLPKYTKNEFVRLDHYIVKKDDTNLVVNVSDILVPIEENGAYETQYWERATLNYGVLSLTQAYEANLNNDELEVG